MSTIKFSETCLVAKGQVIQSLYTSSFLANICQILEYTGFDFRFTILVVFYQLQNNIIVMMPQATKYKMIKQQTQKLDNH